MNGNFTQGEIVRSEVEGARKVIRDQLFSARLSIAFARTDPITKGVHLKNFWYTPQVF